jgi:hypothetical protein
MTNGPLAPPKGGRLANLLELRRRASPHTQRTSGGERILGRTPPARFRVGFGEPTESLGVMIPGLVGEAGIEPRLRLLEVVSGNTSQTSHQQQSNGIGAA